MRKLSELIVLVRGGGEIGSAIAHRLTRSHFRVCITEVASPLAINRGSSFSEAIYETTKTIEDMTAERALPTLDQIYRIWRNGNIPIVVDPELTVKPLLKPDVLINAMMLKRKTNTKITDAPLVIGIGRGFTVGEDVHIVIESDQNNLGKVIVEAESDTNTSSLEVNGSAQGNIIYAADAGVFATEKQIGDVVLVNDIIGQLNDIPIKAPTSGVLCGLLRNESKVLNNAQLAEIDPTNDKSVCFEIRDKMRAISGGTLEAIMMSFNLDQIL